jgi:hypothetical protein
MIRGQAVAGIVTVTGGVQRGGEVRPGYATATASCHWAATSALKIRSVDRETRWSLMIEGVVDGGMDVEKSLRGSRRFEPLHLTLSSPHDLVGVFSAIVLCEPPVMRAGEAQLPESRAVGAQLVGDQQLRCEALFLEQLAHYPECRLRILPTLNSMSRISPSWSTARHRYIRFPAIRMTIKVPSRARARTALPPVPTDYAIRT